MNAGQAARAEAAGIDTPITRSSVLKGVRGAAPRTFFTACLMLMDHPTERDVLEGAMRAMDEGADALCTTGSLRTISMLAELDFPVMGHVRLVPPYGTRTGGLRAYGTTADEAMTLLGPLPRDGSGRGLCHRGRACPARGAGNHHRADQARHLLDRLGFGRRRHFPFFDRHLRRDRDPAPSCQSLRQCPGPASADRGQAPCCPDGLSGRGPLGRLSLQGGLGRDETRRTRSAADAPWRPTRRILA